MSWDPQSEGLWKVFDSKPAKVGTYYASEVRQGPDGALLARDAVTGSRHLLMRIHHSADVRVDRASRGVKLEFRRLDGPGGGLFADFWCADPAKDKLFGVMVDEVLRRWEAGEGTGPTVAARVLAAWRSMLSNESRSVLSTEQQIGLFGELTFLEHLFRKNPNALSCWHGPDGYAQDFVTNEWIAEVKASLNQTSIFVHGPDQLDADPTVLLILHVYRIKLSPQGASLVEQVQKLRDIIGGAEFERKLALSHYRDSDAELYADNRFSVQEATPYRVVQGFPRIVRSEMRLRFDETAVRALSYELLLSSLSDFKLAPVASMRFPEHNNDA